MWHIARPEKDESVIEFFADQGVYTREMFDILLRRGIKEHNIETILEALSGQPSMSIISENEHDICKMHILKWPELDIFDLFLKSGLDSLRVNRIRNRLGFYANIMLKETLVENFSEREFQYAEKAFEVSKLSWIKHQRYPLNFGKFGYWLVSDKNSIFTEPFTSSNAKTLFSRPVQILKRCSKQTQRLQIGCVIWFSLFY